MGTLDTIHPPQRHNRLRAALLAALLTGAFAQPAWACTPALTNKTLPDDMAEMHVYSGQEACTTTINSGGLQNVHSGGTATITTINGGEQLVNAGAAATDTTIYGGHQAVFGTATGTTINGGGQSVDGTATGTTINSGGTLTIHSGTATDTVMKGGRLQVYAGGQLSGSLEVHGTGNRAISGLVFPPLKFFLPAGMSTGDTMLTISGSSPVLSSATVTITDNSGGSLPPIVTLISKTSGTPAGSSGVPSGYTLDASGGALVLRALYSITVNTATGGSVNCNPDTGIAHGTGSSTCTVTEDPGYAFDTLQLVSGTAGINCSGLTCTVSNLESNITVQPTFKKTYTVTGAADPAAGGSVDCPSTKVPHGSGTTCTVTSNTGYSFDKTADVDPAGKAMVTCPTDTACAVSNVEDNVTVTGKFTRNSYTVTGDASTGGSMSCTPATATYFDTITCTPTANPGYSFDQAADTDPAGKATVACTATECKISDVTDNIKVLGVFKLLPKGNATAVPTLGGAGLAFTTLALSAFAVPALRRHKKQGKKPDTMQ